jgi:toxin ParE1/3/4
VTPVVFRKRAEADLRTIGIYTLRTWGLAQAERYLLSIRECCHLLAERPGIGRSCSSIRPGLRRMEHAEHVIFYRVFEDELVVSRILHRSMLPEEHPMQD